MDGERAAALARFALGTVKETTETVNSVNDYLDRIIAMRLPEREALLQNLEDALTMIDDLVQRVHRSEHLPTGHWTECRHSYCRAAKMRGMICLPADPESWTPAMQGMGRRR